MKKMIALLAAFAMTAALTACGPDPADSDVQEDTTSASEEATEASAEEKTTEDEVSDRYSERQTCYKNIDNSEKPEVIRIILSAMCTENLRRHAKVSDLYGVDILHSGVVGLVGAPIELELDETVSSARLSFTYDKEQLRGIPEKNLRMLHYNEEDCFYDTVEKIVLDTDECTVTAAIEEAGVYLLVDAYQWYSCWGMDVSEFAYDFDPTAYATDWERENDTGSIMELADKDWAKENAPNFHVSTAEQLASVVYYVNGINDGEEVTVTLEADIDLTGYDWKPMGWSNAGSHAFSGTVDGKGHTIKGMKISLGYVDCGFVGYGLGVVMKDIIFTDADVKGTACTGIAGGEIYGTTLWTNVHTSGKVSGGSDDYAGIIGREAAITFKDCSTNVTVDGKPFEYLSYRQKRIDDVEIVETFNLTLNNDMTITRDDHEGFRNLCWHIEHNGVQVLERGATDPRTNEPELVLDTKYQWIDGSSGKHTIYLVAYINGAYVRVSNIIEYE